MASALRRKNIKKGLQFTIMVVGTSGLGKSTFINTMCGQNLLPARHSGVVEKAALNPTPYQIELDEDGLKIALTVVDTPGFGDAIDNTSHADELLRYIEQQYDEALMEETRIKRNPKFKDNRVHVLLYFIQPTGHALKEIDVKTMKQLGTRVNIIPVIGRADGLLPAERQEFKKRIMEDIAHYEIPVFNFPYDEEDDEDTIQECTTLKGLMPFAVIGAEGQFNVDGRDVRGRQYPWGIVEVDNAKHCDFSYLRHALLTSHTTDLKDSTEDDLYEIYRTEKLSHGGLPTQASAYLDDDSAHVSSRADLPSQLQR